MSHPSSLSRRQLCLLTAGSLVCPTSLLAQVRADSGRVLCGYPAGGSVDLVSRKVAEKLGRNLAAAFMVDNKPGAAGRLAATELVKAPPDGRTALVTPASVLTMYPHVYSPAGYDPFGDFTPVCTLASTGFVLAVGPRVPAAVMDLRGYLDWCRADPARAQCGNAGAGSMPHFMALLLAREAALPMDHIPFRGGSAAVQAVAAGELGAAIGTEAAARPMAEAGRVRVLSTSGRDRSVYFPQAPTFAESGLAALTQREWFGLFMPARVPRTVVEGSAAALRAAFAETDAKDLLEKSALHPDMLGPAELAQALRREHDFWGPLVRASGFRPES
jgi:tripartite-type tricarboxylate transporter receptor subunit TctC